MAKYIHVITATKVPDILSSSWSDPFKDFTSDPNVGGFGPGERTMWLPVIEPVQPAETAADYYEPTYTDDTAGTPTRGVYVAGPPEEWHFTWNQVARTLEEAKQWQSDRLENDYLTRLDAGFVDDGPGASGKTFELSEIKFGVIVHKKAWYDSALLSGTIPAGRKASVFAVDGTREEFNNFTKFNTFHDAYGLVFDNIQEHWYQKSDDIQAAGNVSQVGNVSWDFSQFS